MPLRKNIIRSTIKTVRRHEHVTGLRHNWEFTEKTKCLTSWKSFTSVNTKSSDLDKNVEVEMKDEICQKAKRKRTSDKTNIVNFILSPRKEIAMIIE